MAGSDAPPLLDRTAFSATLETWIYACQFSQATNGVATMNLTKSDVARRQLVTAIRLFFSDDDPVSVYTLASNAWEVIDELCKLRDIDTVSDQTRKHIGPLKDLGKDYINQPYRNFFKHADRDPHGKAEGFNAQSSEGVLFLAAEDYTRLHGKSPVEVQVYSIWFCSKYPEKLSSAATKRFLPKAKALFPDIGSVERAAQLAMGSSAIEAGIKNPVLMSHPETERSL